MKESFTLKSLNRNFGMGLQSSDQRKNTTMHYIKSGYKKDSKNYSADTSVNSILGTSIADNRLELELESVDKFISINNSSTLPKIKVEESINEKIQKLFNYLLNTSYEPGYLSVADEYFENEFAVKNNAQLISHALNEISIKCYEQAKNHSYLHFLNLLKNATFRLPYALLLPFGIIGTSNKDREIKDLSLSLFESFKYENVADYQKAIKILDNIDTSNYVWLENYKTEIIQDLYDSLRGITNE